LCLPPSRPGIRVYSCPFVVFYEWIVSAQLTHLDGAEVHLVAVVLEEQASSSRAEAREFFVLAARDHGGEGGGGALVVDHLDAVEPVLDDAVRAHDEARVLPRVDLRDEAEAAVILRAGIRS